MTHDPTQVLNDPRLYVLNYLSTNNIIVNERGELNDGTNKNNLEIFDTMYLDYLEQIRFYNAKETARFNADKATSGKNAQPKQLIHAASEKILQKALNELITFKKISFRQEVIDSFVCQTEDLEPLKAFVKAVVGKNSPEDEAVLAHWMWQVKNKMLGNTVTYHIMPILYGKQGGGKTVAITKLIQPLNNFRLNISLDQMTDDRYFKSMSENFVVVFDEMQGAGRSDIDALKKQVTIDYNDYRPLGTNDVFKVKQACSFIGATNRPVAEQIVDTSGMRRFWQVDCQDKLDWDVISSLDYQVMWQGIDENKTDGYILSQIDSISAKQEEMVAKDDISLFMDELGIVAGKTPTKEVLTSVLYNEYKHFCQNNGFKPLASNWFGRKMAGRGVKRLVKTNPDTKKTGNFFLIPEDVVLYHDHLMSDLDFTPSLTSRSNYVSRH